MNIYLIWNDGSVEFVTADINEARLKHEEEIIGIGKPKSPFVEVWNNGKLIDTYDYLYGWRDGKFAVPEIEIRTEFLKEVQKDDSLEELCAFCWALGFELLDESAGFAENEMREKLEYIVTEIDLRDETKMYKDLIHRRRIERGLIKHEIDVELSEDVHHLLTLMGVAEDIEMRSDIANDALRLYFANNPQLLEVSE